MRIQRADAGDAGFQAVLAQGEVDVVEIVFANLDDGAEFFVEECTERIVEMQDFEIDTGVAGERHFDDGRQQAAIGAVVVGEEFFLAAELLDDVPEIFEVGGIVDVGRGFAGLRDDLRENRTTEAIFGTTEIDEDEDGVADRGDGVSGER